MFKYKDTASAMLRSQRFRYEHHTLHESSEWVIIWLSNRTSHASRVLIDFSPLLFHMFALFSCYLSMLFSAFQSFRPETFVQSAFWFVANTDCSVEKSALMTFFESVHNFFATWFVSVTERREYQVEKLWRHKLPRLAAVWSGGCISIISSLKPMLWHVAAGH